MQKILIDSFNLKPQQKEEDLASLVSQKYKVPLKLEKILKKSIDARKKNALVILYRAVFTAEDKDIAQLLEKGCKPYLEPEKLSLKPVHTASVKPQIIIVGAGPAGLFAALRLSEQGIRVKLLEQGEGVEQRHLDISDLKNKRILNPQSNILFGEGGAGTYSDGKLTTRIHKEGIEWLFDQLVQCGAQPAIQYDAKPHIGTDVLAKVILCLRQRLKELGTEFYFHEKVTQIISQSGKAAGVLCASGHEYLANNVILACGHSARELYETLQKSGITLEKKAFALGVRIEHPADFINKTQYGNAANYLPPADYQLTFNNPETQRGTYSFCMCPGGEVINSSSEPGALCVNGMSNSKRDSNFSNAALVVTVGPEDMAGGVLGGIEFQRKLENKAFLAGGGNFTAPAQKTSAFLQKTTLSLPKVSYSSGVVETDFNQLLPDFIVHELRLALNNFDRKMPGFISQGTMIGLESRTSSPVRITRGEDFQSPSLRGLFPAGEGAGYSGGIVSSAVDGIRIADFLLKSLSESNK